MAGRNDTYDWDILCRSRTLCTAGWFMTFWAGAVNAVTSFSVLFMRSSHLTGRVTDQAKYLLTNSMMAVLVTLVIASFILGSFAGTKGLAMMGLTKALLMVALPVALAGLSAQWGIRGSGPIDLEPGRFVLAFLIPFGMGWQNSVTSQGKMGRTTHITGDLTDLGIALAKNDSPRAAYLFSKYLGFLSGGIVGYFASTWNPGLTLVLCSMGFCLTVLTYDVMNTKSALSVKTRLNRVTE